MMDLEKMIEIGDRLPSYAIFAIFGSAMGLLAWDVLGFPRWLAILIGCLCFLPCSIYWAIYDINKQQ